MCLPYAVRTRRNAASTLASEVRSIQTHSAAGGGCGAISRSKPTSRYRSANLSITAEPMKPLLPVTTTSFLSSFIIASAATVKRCLLHQVFDKRCDHEYEHDDNQNAR